MITDEKKVRDFLCRQRQEYGTSVEVESGLWILFAVPVADAEENEIARALLAPVTFAHDSELTEDDQWRLYYVDTANRAEAAFWIEDQVKALAGEIRPASPAVRALLEEIVTSDRPHRAAQALVERHGRGEVGAGVAGEAQVVRALLDRLHAHEPLFFSAFELLLLNHLIDMIVLLQQIIPEDVALQNEVFSGALSRDPFLQTRQKAAGEIRSCLVRFHVINALDQAKSTAIANPYAAYLDIARAGDQVSALVDGVTLALPCTGLITGIHAVRRNLYRGEQFSRIDTQAPWMDEEVARAFRFIRQRLDLRRELSPLDGLYMLERSVTL
jgi:hypothetical protein